MSFTQLHNQAETQEGKNGGKRWYFLVTYVVYTENIGGDMCFWRDCGISSKSCPYQE